LGCSLCKKPITANLTIALAGVVCGLPSQALRAE
jgi:hypothetical protein